MCGGAFLLMVRLAFFLVHSCAFFLVFSRTMLLNVICAVFFMNYRAFLHIHSVAHLFHLRLAMFVLDNATLLLKRGTALVFVGRHSLVLGVTGPLDVCGPEPVPEHLLGPEFVLVPLLE